MRWKESERSSSEIAPEMKISKRRVNQIWKRISGKRRDSRGREECREAEENDNGRRKKNSKRSGGEIQLGERRLERIIKREHQ